MNSEVREEVLVKTGDQNLPFRLGRNTWITVVRQDFSDQVDLILGTRGGGIIYLKSTQAGSPNEGEFLVKLFPNPSSGIFKVITNTGAVRLADTFTFLHHTLPTPTISNADRITKAIKNLENTISDKPLTQQNE